jgi:hypothetical protein
LERLRSLFVLLLGLGMRESSGRFCEGRVEVDAHYYSVPHRFVRAEVEVRFTARTVEIFHKGERIAVHQRMSGNHKHTTVPEHMASSHRRYAAWTIERIRSDAASIGPATAALCELTPPSSPAAPGRSMARADRRSYLRRRRPRPPGPQRPPNRSQRREHAANP